MNKSADIRLFLGLARLALADSLLHPDANSRARRDGAAGAYYLAAWHLAGGPAQCDEWPGYAVWSARETMKRAA